MFSKNKILPGFIVLEGLDGSGTTTQQRKLKQVLRQKGVSYYSTSEPTNNSIGKLISDILSAKHIVEKKTLAHLFAADRYEHLHGTHGILNETAAGKLIVCTRYLFSSLAYQGADLGIEAVWELNKHFPLPEILFFLDTSPKEAENRYKSRETLDIYEKLEVHEQVRVLYKHIFSELANSAVRFYRIDASQEVEKVFTEIWGIVSEHPIVKG